MTWVAAVDKAISNALGAVERLVAAGLTGRAEPARTTTLLGNLLVLSRLEQPASIVPITAAGLDTLRKSLTVAQNSIARRMLHASLSDDLPGLRADTGFLTIISRYTLRALSLFGHIMRLPEQHLTRRILRVSWEDGRPSPWLTHVLSAIREFAISTNRINSKASWKRECSRRLRVADDQSWKNQLGTGRMRFFKLADRKLELDESLDDLNAYERAVIRSARAGRLPLNSELHRRGLTDTPVPCPRCDRKADETVLHLLTECPASAAERKKLTEDIRFAFESRQAPRDWHIPVSDQEREEAARDLS